MKPAMEAISPYDENFAVQSDMRQYLPSEVSKRTALEVDTASDNMRDIVQDSSSLSLGVQKPYGLLNEQDKEPMLTTTQPTPKITKKQLKRTVKIRPTASVRSHTAAKPVRHYSGKLQDIYDKLDRVIATSLKKNRKLRG